MTTFKPPVPAQFTPYAELNLFIQNIQNYLTQLSTDLNAAFVPQMSETPQRIGTWVDGTPIWRVAFEVKIADIFDNADDFETALSDGVISIGYTFDLGIVSHDVYTALVNASAIFTNSVATKSPIDDVMLPFGNGAPWGNADIALSNYLKDLLTSVGYSGLTDEGIYGYIDFATPESNIKTGDAE
jgi:hypothetical protein